MSQPSLTGAGSVASPGVRLETLPEVVYIPPASVPPMTLQERRRMEANLESVLQFDAYGRRIKEVSLGIRG